MDNNTDSVEDCLLFFQKAVPEPTTKNIHTQIGCHFEEVCEMIDTLTPLNEQTDVIIATARNALHDLAEHLKANDEVMHILPENRIDFADAVADQMVTAIGSAHMERVDIMGAFNEVNDSNLSKFGPDGEPIFDANRKVQKGPNYRKADLAPFV